MIVIMGATGCAGHAALQAGGHAVRAISRQPRTSTAQVQWVAADAFDAEALARVFQGAQAAFVMNPVAPGSADVYADAARISTAVAQALDAAAVPHAVALSSQGAHLAQGTGVVRTLYDFEHALRGLRTPVTVLRSAYFLDTWLPLAEAALHTGALPAFFDPPTRPVDAVATQDLGAVAAQLLLAPPGGIVDLVGPAPCSDQAVADTLARLAGRAVAVAPVPAAHIAAAFEAEGLGPSFATALADMYAGLNRDGLPFEPGSGRRIQGTVTLEAMLAPLVAAWRR